MTVGCGEAGGIENPDAEGFLEDRQDLALGESALFRGFGSVIPTRRLAFQTVPCEGKLTLGPRRRRTGAVEDRIKGQTFSAPGSPFVPFVPPCQR